MYKYLVSLSLASVLLVSSCREVANVGKDAIADAVAEIDKSVNDINANSAQWQNIVNQLPDKLKGKVDATIQNELTHFVEHSVGVVAEQTVCTVDILGKRAINFLKKVRQAILGGAKENLTAPTVCQVPSSIELSSMPVGHRIVEASGADFLLTDQNKRQMQAVFRSDSKDVRIPIDESRIGRTTNYRMTINLDGEDIAKIVKENEINKILFLWNDTNVEQPQVLVLKHVPGKNEVIVSIGNVSLIPRHVGGDQGNDLNDDNPFVTEVSGKVFVSPDNKKVLYNLFMHGRESKPDNTEVRGWLSEVQTGTTIINLPLGGAFAIPVFAEGPGIVAYSAPDGWKIVSVSPVGETKGSMNITKHGNQNLFMGDGQVVRVFVLNGGEGGGEAGNSTSVIASFGNLLIKIQEAE